jgi:hypothetical protein
MLSATRVTKPADYRNAYILYLQRNWATPHSEGFMMSALVREMAKINHEYVNPRDTNFGIELPEADVLVNIASTKTANNRPLPGFNAAGEPVKVGFSLHGGRFSLVRR